MKVIAVEAVTSNGTTYAAGETFDLPKESAEKLIEMGVVKAAPDSNAASKE